MDKILKDLQYKLSREYLESEGKLSVKFAAIAEILLKKVAIKKGNDLYYITDIEFYWFSNSHRDIITYPRNTKAGEWFFHMSGVDIAFESWVKTEKAWLYDKNILTPDAKFGGVLIRGIKPVTDGKPLDVKQLNDHPKNICEKLFDQFDAFGNQDGVPRLVVMEHTGELSKPDKRHNIDGKKPLEERVRQLMKNYKDSYLRPEELYDVFQKSIDFPYRYTIKQ